MYKSIPESLTNKELTTVVHYVIKMLNKYKSKENKDLKFNDLPFRESNEKLDQICNNLLDEIGIEDLREQDEKLDAHIESLFNVLISKIKIEIKTMSNNAEELLKKFKKE